MHDRRSLCAFIRVQGHVVDMVSLNTNKYPIDWDKIASPDAVLVLWYDSGIYDHDHAKHLLRTL